MTTTLTLHTGATLWRGKGSLQAGKRWSQPSLGSTMLITSTRGHSIVTPALPGMNSERILVFISILNAVITYKFEFFPHKRLDRGYHHSIYDKLVSQKSIKTIFPLSLPVCLAMISLHLYHLLSPISHVLQRGTSRCWCRLTRTTQPRSQTGCRCTPALHSSEYRLLQQRSIFSVIN